MLRCLLAGAGLIGGFLAIVAWFGVVDVWHTDFFAAGPLTAVNNLARIGFILILAWLIYAPGAGIASLVVPPAAKAALTPLERAVTGFGIGIGLWYVTMLILGVFGLYYRWVAIVLCLGVLLASAPHFAAASTSALRGLRSWSTGPPQGERRQQAWCIALILACGAWLLVVRGLYPGGGGDYYTHYFPYYLEVIKNHGLAPNDVWYHYYYSKGSGLAFLGMLLTDPESPTLSTFCCVAFAAAAIGALAARISPGSLWPTVTVVLYLLFNLVELNDIGGSGGEFQKDHEVTTALVVLAVWGLCMAPVFGRRVGLPVTTSSACAAAIISQPMGVILALYLSSLVVLALLRRRWRDFFMLAIAATTVAGSLLVMLALSFIQTGMATDQQLDLMLRFANIGRLDAWGVLPQLVMVAWIRANYSELAPPVGWAVFGLLQRFTRIEFLWLVVVGAMLAYGVAISRTASQRFRQAFTVPPICIAAATHTAFLIVLLLLISAATGRVQHISYERFSSFFAPLLLLLAVAIAGLALARGDPVLRWWLARPLPAVLLVATLVVWQATAGWADRVANVTSHGLRFLGGIYSLADAYAHQGGGYWFGGINPDALAASRQVEPGTPIWSTNVASYCMVPGCHIESVSSFKMSPRLDEILAGPPERAKVLLQKAGLNYFLFSKDIPLLDVLPYSHLFAPETIGRFLGIKWSNGSAYLLTWAGPGTRPLDAGFIDAYTKRLASDDSEWFEFRTLAEQISQAVTRLRSSGPDRPARFDFALTAPPADGIDVIEATYGRSCRTYRPQPPATNTFRVGNATRALRRACSGKPYCSFTVSIPPLVDPAGGCDKDIAVTYRCPADPAPRTAAIPILAYGKAVELDCRTAR